MTQVGTEAKSHSELDNLEKWIAQKRAEIAKEKAEIGGDKENNVPPTVTSKSQPPTQINRGSVGQPVQSNEPLIFKLGDDYQLRKARFNDELKTQFKNTQIEHDAAQRALNRQSYDKSNPPYFEVVGQDLFTKRPSTAQVKAAKQAAYKRELEAQLKDREERNRRRPIRVATPNEFIIQTSSNRTKPVTPRPRDIKPTEEQLDLSIEEVRLPTPGLPQSNPPPPGVNRDVPHSVYQVPPPQSVNQPGHPIYPPGYGYAYPPPGYGYPMAPPQPPAPEPAPKTPARDAYDSELAAALQRGTMENVMNQARLDHSIPHSNFNSSFQNSTFSHQAPPAVPPIHIPETRKSVQIQEIKTPMISPRKVTYANDNDIFNVGQPKVANGRESQKENYRSELFEQMREKDRKKAEEKRKQELYDLKLEREMQNYDPFGKGGGGAPVRDTKGRLMTDLRQMKVLNDTVQNNMDKVYELKDVHQTDVTTPRPMTHSRIESPPPQRITEYGQPKTKVDFDYRDYLLAEAERKKREKQEAIEREKAEDLKAEQKFIRQQEQLRQEAEQEKFRKIEEDRAKVAQREEQFRANQQSAAPKTPNHEVMGRKKKLIELDNWDENARMLEEKLQNAKQGSKPGGANEIPRTPIRKTPVSTNLNQHQKFQPPSGPPTSRKTPPPQSRKSPTPTTVSSRSGKTRKPTLRQSTSQSQTKIARESRSKTPNLGRRQNSALSVISWDNQSVYGQGSTAQQPPQYYRQPPPPTQSHYHPSHAAHPASHRVVSQLDQLKKQIKDEYLRIQYNLNQQRLQERDRHDQLTEPSIEDIRRTSDRYVEEAEAELRRLSELSGADLLKVPNEDGGIDTGKTVRLDDATETTYVDAQGLEHPGVPDQPADYRSEIGESELDYEDLTRKNTERMKDLNRMEESHDFHASPDKPNQPQVLTHSNQH